MIEECEIIDIQEVECKDEFVYNLEVEDNHNYFADNILVSNCHAIRQNTSAVLLKTLEEPPSHSVFILCTTDPQKVLPTIRSRCQVYQFRRIKNSEIVDHLEFILRQEQIQHFEKPALEAIAKAANGSMRDALSSLDAIIGRCGNNITEKETLDILGLVEGEKIFEVVKSIWGLNYQRALLNIRLMINNFAKDPKDIFGSLLEFLHDMMLSKCLNSHQNLFIPKAIENEWLVLRNEMPHMVLAALVKKIGNYMNELSFMPRSDLVLTACVVEMLEIVKLSKGQKTPF